MKQTHYRNMEAAVARRVAVEGEEGVVLAVGITGLAGLLIAALLARNIRPAH